MPIILKMKNGDAHSLEDQKIDENPKGMIHFFYKENHRNVYFNAAYIYTIEIVTEEEYQLIKKNIAERRVEIPAMTIPRGRN